MAESFVQADPPALKKASDAVNYPAGVVKKALATFYAKVGALPPAPWGDDEIGKKFAEAYEGYKDDQPDDRGRRGHYKLLGSLSDMVNGLHDLGGKVKDMAEAYEAAEDANNR